MAGLNGDVVSESLGRLLNVCVLGSGDPLQGQLAMLGGSLVNSNDLAVIIAGCAFKFLEIMIFDRVNF